LCTIVGDQVCYNHIGCFQNTPPYTNSLGKLPKSPDYIRPSFTLHTRQNVNSTSQQLDPYRPSTITASSYDVHHKTAFIVHGFHGTKNDEWVQPLVKALLDEVWVVFIFLHFRWVTRQLPLVEQKLVTIPMHMSSVGFVLLNLYGFFYLSSVFFLPRCFFKHYILFLFIELLVTSVGTSNFS